MTDAPVRAWPIAFMLLSTAVFIAARMFAAGTSASEGDDTLVVCRHPELDQGSSQRTEVAAVKRAYSGLKKDLEKSMAVQKTKAIAALNLAHDAGLPRCRSSQKRMVTLRDPLPQQFRGRAFYYISLDGGFEDVPWEAEIAKDQRAEILLLKAERPAAAGELARRLGRPVTFASKDLADALGIQCSPTKVSVGENGRDLILAEGR